MTTKAKTKGERRRAKQGRPPKAGGFYANGKRRRASRAGKSKEQFEAKRPVLMRRCRERGIKDPTPEQLRDMDRASFGTELGKRVMHKDVGKRITPEQEKAGYDLQDLEAEYRITMGYRPRHAQSAAYGEVRGGARERSQSGIEAVRARYSASQAIWRTIPVQSRRALERICLDDLPVDDLDLPALRVGLDAYRRFFLGEVKKAA